jgi:hypothetical protein
MGLLEVYQRSESIHHVDTETLRKSPRTLRDAARQGTILVERVFLSDEKLSNIPALLHVSVSPVVKKELIS